MAPAQGARPEPGPEGYDGGEDHENAFQHDVSATKRRNPAQPTDRQVAVLVGGLLGWLMQREATLQLASLSDRELQDIGLRRCEIEGAVRGALKRERAFCRRY